jgi:ATP-dependent DNA helicase RecG
MYKINLKELLYKENEQVEWKENVADIPQVVKTLVAIANDYSNLGGGYVVCGVKEIKDSHGFPSVELIGLSSDRFKQIQKTVLDTCLKHVFPSIVPIIEEVKINEEKRILIFIMPASKRAHSFKAGSSEETPNTYYIRTGNETREARNGLQKELLIRKNEIEPWDARHAQGAEIKDLDLLAMREYLQNTTHWQGEHSIEEYISDEKKIYALAPTLCVKEPIKNQLVPRNFALLLFGKKERINHFIPGAHCIISFYPGTDRSEPYGRRLEIAGNLIEQAKKLIDLLNMETYYVYDKTDLKNPNTKKYPERAIQEAIINALVHRDFELNQPVRVTVFSNRIEIFSPGSLLSAINKEKFTHGEASPVWRNQALIYFFVKLNLAQNEGQGVSTIFKTMKNAGCPPPIFDITSDNITCILYAHSRHKLKKNKEAKK